jgi:tetratricopeptide (TPR) repeat protein
MPFDLFTLISRGNRAIYQAAHEYKYGPHLLALFNSALTPIIIFEVFNPHEWPLPNLVSIFPQLKYFGWYEPVFWSIIGASIIEAIRGGMRAARARIRPVVPEQLKPGAIKGLLPFAYEDAEIFSHLQRGENLKECLQAIVGEQWRFGALIGESGVGKTSFLQAGLRPELEKLGFRCVYVKFSDLDPLESVKRACLKHLQFTGGEPNEGDFQGLLLSAAQDRTPIILFFDQFEQFFVHRKRKKDREPFTKALARCFAETRSLPIKILICVRGDFFDRLNELQKAMGYSLGPAQSFRLERFEQDRATEILCFLAEKNGLEYDREFISEMARDEMAGAEDGLISPVEIQVLARLIEWLPAQGPRAFNRATLQKIGGAQVSLGLYLITALKPLISRSSRRAAIDILLALTDLEYNARAGAMTFEDFGQKLGGDISGSRLKDVAACLWRDDLPLITTSPENGEEKFELAHERLIVEVLELAGNQATEADYANQLLDHCANLWLGNGCASGYLFTWSELRLIKKHRRSDASIERRQEKEKFLAASRRRLRFRFAAVGLVVLLLLSGRIGWYTNAWQTYMIKRYLYSQSFRINQMEVSDEIAEALIYAGDPQLALKVLDWSSSDYAKAYALAKAAESYIKLGDKEKSGAMLSDLIKMAERMDGLGKAKALGLITRSYIKLGDKGKAESCISEWIKAAERIRGSHLKAEALSDIARSYVSLGDTMKAAALLKEAIKTLEQPIGGWYRAYVLREIASSYSEIGKTVKDSAPLEEAIKVAGQINEDWYKADALISIVRSYARFGKDVKDGALLKEAIKVAGQISEDLSKTSALSAIAESYAALGDKKKALALLEDAIKTAERIDERQSEADALVAVVESYAQIGKTMKDAALLSEAVKIAGRIKVSYFKTEALGKIARAYAGIGETMKDAASLSEAIKILARIGDRLSEVHDFQEIIRSYARLEDKGKARALLEDVIKAPERGERKNKAFVLDTLVDSYVELGETMRDSSLLEEAVRFADRTGNDSSYLLTSIVKSYARLGKEMKDRALLEEASKIAGRISDDRYKPAALNAVARSYAELGETMKARPLLKEAIEVADKIDDFYDKPYALSEAAESYARLGDNKRAHALIEEATRTAKLIDSDSALSAILKSCVNIAEASNDSAWLYDITFRLISRPQHDSDKDKILGAYLSSKLAVADVGRLRSLAAYYDNQVERTKALTRILIACSHPELIRQKNGIGR